MARRRNKTRVRRKPLAEIPTVGLPSARDIRNNLEAFQNTLIRQKQMEAYDKLPKSVRNAVAYAPAKYDPVRVANNVRELGAKKTVKKIKLEMEMLLWELNREKGL